MARGRRGQAQPVGEGRHATRPPPLPQADNILALTKAAGVEVEPYWPGLFAKLVEKKSIDVSGACSGGGAKGSDASRR